MITLLDFCLDYYINIFNQLPFVFNTKENLKSYAIRHFYRKIYSIRYKINEYTKELNELFSIIYLTVDNINNYKIIKNKKNQLEIELKILYKIEKSYFSICNSIIEELFLLNYCDNGYKILTSNEVLYSTEIEHQYLHKKLLKDFIKLFNSNTVIYKLFYNADHMKEKCINIGIEFKN